MRKGQNQAIKFYQTRKKNIEGPENHRGIIKEIKAREKNITEFLLDFSIHSCYLDLKYKN